MDSLRIATSTGHSVYAPDRALLARTVAHANAAGDVIVLDGDADADSPFLQATRESTGWRVEAWRIGGTRDGYRAPVVDDAALVDLLWSWAEGTDAWLDARWEPIEAAA